MPPLPPVPFVLRCKLIGLNQTHQWMNGFHIKYFGGSPTSADLSTLAQTIGTVWNTNIAPVTHSTTSLETVELIDLASSQGAEGSNTASHPGTIVTGTPLPVDCCMVISWPASLRWRGGHFRTYSTGLNDAALTNGSTFTSSAQNSHQQAWDLFRVGIAGMAGAQAPYGLVGVRYKGKDTTIQYPFVANLNVPIVHPRLDSQRRRLGAE